METTTLFSKSPEFWAHQAKLEDLIKVVRAIEEWGEDEAEVLDVVYMERVARLMERARTESRRGARDLADHLERVTHDQMRETFEALSRPYFARWRLLVEMLHRAAERLTVPDAVLARKHVMEILRAVWQAGGRLGQGWLDMIDNEGQRSVTLKLMEQWDLIERVKGNKNERIVVLTDLGQLALGERALAPAAIAAAEPPRPVDKQLSPKERLYRPAA